ncbi:hypothetical protein D3C73_1665210 [compost metagenome]
MQACIPLQGNQAFKAASAGHPEQNFGEALIIFNNQDHFVFGRQPFAVIFYADG